MPEISKITLPSGTTYDLKDSTARAAMSGTIVIKGTTTTALTDEATTNPIVIDGDSYTAVANDAVFYGKKEFVFDGTKWHEFGDMSGLGALATKDSASGTYTPAGNVSVTPTTTTAYVAESADGGGSVTAGTACTMPTYTVSNETLTITGGSANTPTAVTLPSFSSQTVATGVDSASFTGTEATITVS